MMMLMMITTTTMTMMTIMMMVDYDDYDKGDVDDSHEGNGVMVMMGDDGYVYDGDDGNDDDDNDDDDYNDDDDDSDCYEVEGVCNKVFTLNSIATTWNFTATIPLKVMGAAVALDNNYRLVIIGGFSEGEITKKVSVVSFQ